MRTSLVVLAFLASGCFFDKRDDAVAVKRASRITSLHPATPDEGPHLVDLSGIPVGVGVRDFGQLNHAMSSLTGVDAATVQTTFNGVTSLLPATNDVKAISGPNLVSVTRLGAGYCDSLVATAGARRDETFPGINFGVKPSVITRDMRDRVLGALLTRFLRETVPPSEDLAELTSLYEDLKVALQDRTQSTAAILAAACTVALGSPKAVLVY